MAILGLKWINGVLHYRDGCCDWLPVPGGAAALAPSVTPAPAPSELTNPESPWYDNPDIFSYGEFGRDKAQISEQDRKDLTRCIKATAMVNVTFDALTRIINELESNQEYFTLAGKWNLALSGIAGYFFPPAGFIMSGLSAYLTMASAGISAAMDFRDNELTSENRASLICQLTPLLSDVDDITNADVSNAVAEMWLGAWEGFTFVNTTFYHLDLMQFVQSARAEMAAETCGCYAVTNPGELPPLAIGCTRWTYASQADRWTGQSAPFEIVTARAFGSRLGVGVYQTTYWGQDLGRTRDALGILIKFDEPALMQMVRLDVEYSGYPVATDWELDIRAFNADTNQWVGKLSQGAGGFSTSSATGLSYTTNENNTLYAEYYWLSLTGTTDTGSNPRGIATISNLAFDGQSAATAFHTLHENEQQCV